MEKASVTSSVTSMFKALPLARLLVRWRPMRALHCDELWRASPLGLTHGHVRTRRTLPCSLLLATSVAHLEVRHHGVCIARAQPRAWRDGHRANERYACHAARCCKQLDRRTLSGPCFSLLAISAHPHILLRCVSCSLAACAQLLVQMQHRVCQRTTSSWSGARHEHELFDIGDRAASCHRELASVEHSMVYVAPSA